MCIFVFFGDGLGRPPPMAYGDDFLMLIFSFWMEGNSLIACLLFALSDLFQKKGIGET